MYALVVLLSLVVAAAFTEAFVWRRRVHLITFALGLAGLVYTHNWGLFLAAGSLVPFAMCWRASPQRRAMLRDGALAYGGLALLYLPWVPSLLFQAAHTGAPWSERPTLTDVLGPITGLLGDKAVPLGLLFAAGAGLATIAREPAPLGTANRLAPHPRQLAMQALVALPLAGLTLAWLASQVSPAFAGRYFAVFVGPVLLLSGIGLARAGRLGVIALCIVLALWLDPLTHRVNAKSNVRAVASKVKNDVMAGDLVVSVHPEQMPLLHYYFPPGLKYATALGPAPDPLVFDWRDAMDKLEAAGPKRTLAPMVAAMRPGQTLILTLPIIRTSRWGAPWTALVRRRTAQWERAAERNDQLVRVGPVPDYTNKRLPRGVRVVLYRRTAS